MRSALEHLLRAYKRWVSPLLPPSCRYTPTCSEYAQEAVARFGVARGSALALWRVLRCHPLAKGGYDPVSCPEWTNAAGCETGPEHHS